MTIPPTLDGVVSDANNALRTNILDLQHVVRDVLLESEDSAPGDANKDGRVDILDFQGLMHDVYEAGESEDSAPPPRKKERAVLTSFERFAPRIPQRLILTIPGDEDHTTVPASTCHDFCSLLMLKEQCLLCMAPHAPPASRGLRSA